MKSRLQIVEGETRGDLLKSLSSGKAKNIRQLGHEVISSISGRYSALRLLTALGYVERIDSHLVSWKITRSGLLALETAGKHVSALPPPKPPEAPWEGSVSGFDDPLYDVSVAAVKELSSRGNRRDRSRYVVVIQRRLRIGYERACELIDLMIECGDVTV